MALANSRALCLLLLSLALCQTVSGTLTSDIQEVFKVITTQSENLRISTQKITFLNAPVQGPTIPAGFLGISHSITQVIDEISRSEDKPLSDDDAKLLVEALTTFVQVQQALLNEVIGKHSVPTLAPFFPPIRQSLVTLEAVVDSFKFHLIAKIPNQTDAANKQFGSLDTRVREAIRTYEGSYMNSELPSELPLGKGSAVV